MFVYICRDGSVIGQFSVQTAEPLSAAQQSLLFIQLAQALQDSQVTVLGENSTVSINVTVVDTMTDQGTQLSVDV